MVEHINQTEENLEANELPPLLMSKGKAKDLQNSQPKFNSQDEQFVREKKSIAYKKVSSEVLAPIEKIGVNSDKRQLTAFKF